MAHYDWTSLLRSQGEAILRDHPSITHQWEQRGSALELRIPAISAKGFDVDLVADSDGITLTAGGFHAHFDAPGDAAQEVRAAFGLVRDLLSEGMRLRELRAGNLPYRWILEVASPEGWAQDHETGLLLWNFFGRRSERIYQNNHLPPRFPERSIVERT